MAKNKKLIVIAFCIIILTGFLLKQAKHNEAKTLDAKDILELCFFEKNSDLAKIEKDKVTKELSKEKVKEGKYSLKCDFPVGGGSISFYSTLTKNWFGYKYLKFDVYSEDDVTLSLFVADKQNTKYKDRYNKERISLKEGWNEIQIPLSDIGKKISLDGINHLVIFLWKTEQKNTLYIDSLRLANDEGNDNQTTNANIKVYINPAVEKGKVSPLLYGSNLCAKMESAEYIRNFVKERGITCFRFPGGGSPGWHWKTGKGDFSKKMENMPLAKIDYLIEFCKATNTKLIMQVNIESGTPQEAAELVEYMNKTANFRVDYWELGNEAYGDWDKAYTSAEQYAQLVKDYSKTMKAKDPNIKIGADWGGGKWNETIMKEASDYIDFVSYHWYPNHTNKTHKLEGRSHPICEEVMANAMVIPSIVNRFNKLIERHAAHRKGKIEITFLEWDGAWDAPASDPEPPYAQNIVQWSLANAIFYADSLGKFAENGVTASTHYSLQECMFGLIRGWDPTAGWGGIKWDGQTIRPKAFAIELYSKHFGDILIETKLENSPSYYKNEDYWPGSYSGQVPYITCYASKFNNDKKLGIILLNKHSYNDYDVEIAIDPTFKVNNTAKIWVLNGPALLAQNDGQPGSVVITGFNLSNLSNNFKYKLPAHSVVAMEVELL